MNIGTDVKYRCVISTCAKMHLIYIYCIVSIPTAPFPSHPESTIMLANALQLTS